ncbi:MAG: Gp37Gp68 family protein [Halomonas sp. 54_146]|nr:phage Gp37/Gp68 family protein [Halomonas sp. 54_146]KUJ86489.1 MAG: Gp37Gp68 family protein [Halomonas sp. 54_146]
MSSKSSIEWTEHTWNPMTGCTKVSPGCKHCYAEEMAKRLQAMGTPGYENGFELSLLEERLEQPFRRKKPTKYFVNSMSDLFHEAVPVEFLDRVFDVIRRTPHHTYQILTKRAERMSRYFETIEAPTNAWIGVSVEDKKYGVPRIQHLRDVAATVRFLSVEPLLEDVGPLDLTDIHWVIVGGESGRYARPLKEEWVNQVRQQCEDQGVAFFFKQWGTWGADGKKRNKKANGRELQGKVWDEMPKISALHL